MGVSYKISSSFQNISLLLLCSIGGGFGLFIIIRFWKAPSNMPMPLILCQNAAHIKSLDSCISYAVQKQVSDIVYIIIICIKRKAQIFCLYRIQIQENIPQRVCIINFSSWSLSSSSSFFVRFQQKTEILYKMGVCVCMIFRQNFRIVIFVLLLPFFFAFNLSFS